MYNYLKELLKELKCKTALQVVETSLLSVAIIPAFAGGLYAYMLTGLISKSWESYANIGVFAKQVTTTLASWRVFPWRPWLLLYRILLICAITYVYFSWIGIRIHIQLIYAFLSRRLDLTCNFGLGW